MDRVSTFLIGLGCLVAVSCGGGPSGDVYFLLFEGDEISGSGGNYLLRGHVDGGSFSASALIPAGDVDVMSFDISPSGSQIVAWNNVGATSMGSGTHGLYVVNTDGSDLRNLEVAVEWPNLPKFLSESRIVFSGRDNVANTDNLYTVNVDGSDLSLLVSDFLLFGQPVVSPDGTRIAAVTLESDWQSTNLVVVDVSSGAVTPIKHFASPGPLLARLLFAADGQRIIFCQQALDDEPAGIRSIGVDGSDERFVYSATPGTWAQTPEGDLLYSQGAVVTLGLDGTARPEVIWEPPQIQPSYHATQAAISQGGDILFFVASHDGSLRLHFTEIGASGDHETSIAPAEGIFELTSVW